MRHVCTRLTDLDELIGLEQAASGESVFRYGPLPQALRNDEELVLENSASLSRLTVAKILTLLNGLYIPETEECLQPGSNFRLTLR